MNKWTRLFLTIALWAMVAIAFPWWMAMLVGFLTGGMLVTKWHRAGELESVFKKISLWCVMKWRAIREKTREKIWKPILIGFGVALVATLIYGASILASFISLTAIMVIVAVFIGYGMLSVKSIPPDIYRAVSFLGRRSYWLGEGWHIVPFGICWLSGSVKNKKQNTDGEFSVITREVSGNLELETKFSVLWMPDKNNLFTFFRISPKDVNNEIGDAVREVILAVAGNRPASDFIERVEYVQLLIECLLSLPREKIPCGHSIAEALDYCHHNKVAVQKLLADNENRSEIETKLGIVIEMFSLSDTGLSEAVRNAREAASKAESERKAAEIKAEADRRVAEIKAEADRKSLEIRETGKRELRKELIGAGVAPAEAVEATEVAFGQATRAITSVRGLELPKIAEIIVSSLLKK